MDSTVIDTDVPLLTTPDTAQLYRDCARHAESKRCAVSRRRHLRVSVLRRASARTTKDFDIFVRPRDVHRVLDVLSAPASRPKSPSHHWLAKAHHGEKFIDVIFSSGNGIAEVDDEWFAHAVDEKCSARR